MTGEKRRALINNEYKENKTFLLTSVPPIRFQSVAEVQDFGKSFFSTK